MAVVSKFRRNAFLMGLGLLLFGILYLVVSYRAYKGHDMVPAGEGPDFMTPTQGFIVAGIAFAFAAYAFARAILGNNNQT